MKPVECTSFIVKLVSFGLSVQQKQHLTVADNTFNTFVGSHHILVGAAFCLQVLRQDVRTPARPQD